MQQRRPAVGLPVAAVLVGRSRGYPLELTLAKLATRRWFHMVLTVRRYSTALSGLLKAARIAASIWVLSKPMASMLAMASARSAPMAKPETPPDGDSTERLGVGVAGGGAWLDV